MQEKASVPAIRFVGFTDAWEQRKLGEIFEEYSEKDHADLPALMIVQGGGTILRDSSDRNLMYDKANLANYKMVRAGDFIVHLRSFEGGLEMATNTGIISPAYHTLHGSDADSIFYYSYFRSKKFIDSDLKPHVYGIRDGRSIDIEGMKTIKIPYTSFPEQKAIGKFIQSLDYLIIFHQRKYSRLCNIKKSMLERMFPRDGAKVPEIRFAGFADAWEQRKLGEVCQVNGRIGFRGYTRKDIISQNDGGILTFSPTNIVDNRLTLDVKNTYITKEKFEESPEIQISNGDILFVKTGSTLGKSALVSELFEPASINPQIVVLRSVKDLQEIVSVILTSSSIQKQVEAVKIGGAVPTMTESKLKDFAFWLPRSKDEKIKIGTFFRHLDHLITLHQRELERLQNIKKSCLEKMFV